ncbi:hypothetical protein B0919_16945 [Hymenobacter sp. CRA2]|nr:hypothetical protein B0919_16945 [Hymenobacter sp. CRA2]
MQQYHVDALATDIEKRMKTRFLSPILDIEGGWEYWIQIDFPVYLDVFHSTQYDFRREVAHMFGYGGRLDWVLNSQLGGYHAHGCRDQSTNAQIHQ